MYIYIFGVNTRIPVSIEQDEKYLSVFAQRKEKRRLSYRTFDRGTEVSAYRISTGQGQPAMSHEKRVRKKRRQRRDGELY